MQILTQKSQKTTHFSHKNIKKFKNFNAKLQLKNIKKNIKKFYDQHIFLSPQNHKNKLINSKKNLHLQNEPRIFRLLLNNQDGIICERN